MEQLKLFEPPDSFILSINSESRKTLKIMSNKGLQVDSIVTDPPYELGFMGKSWDSTGIAYDKELWELCFNVLKPGGHLLAFGGSRTYHRMAVAIEDAGFQIRDQIMWLYGQGFPKSLNISKAIDKMAGAERKIIGESIHSANRIKDIGYFGTGHNEPVRSITSPTTDAAKQWNGWGSALKPAHEPIMMARKPLSEKNIASNVLKHGAGGINIDGCRVGVETITQRQKDMCAYRGNSLAGGQHLGKVKQLDITTQTTGRFPANVIYDGSDEVMEEFAKYGESVSSKKKQGYFGESKKGLYTPTMYLYTAGNTHSDNGTAAPFFKEAHYTEEDSIRTKAESPVYEDGFTVRSDINYIDSGNASRFFYSAKASKRDRCGSKHPTVKPISLMRYLCRLVTPPGGIVLDPFAGTGTTGQAAQDEGFHAVLIERETEYFNDITRRIYE